MTVCVLVLTLVSMMTLKMKTEAKTLYWSHKLVTAFPSSISEVRLLLQLEDAEHLMVDFWRPPSHPGNAVDMSVSPDDFIKLTKLLNQHKILHKVQMFDLQAVINKQDDLQSKSSSWHSKYHTLDEIVSQMKQINNTSYMVNMESLGKSFENREQYILKIQANQNVTKSLIFINCGIHAREWISPASCMYITHQLIIRLINTSEVYLKLHLGDPSFIRSPAFNQEISIVHRYGEDLSVTAMMNKVDLAILPVLNVDGYVYTWTKDRLWRKNRSPNNGSNCFGTDLNRNWQFGWGAPGASDKPCSDVYQGASVMSEKEVQNVDRFLKSEKKRLVGFVDVHNYSQMWMIPWGYAMENIKDYDELMRVGKATVDAIKLMEFNTTYALGPSSRLLYLSSGTLQDYVYGSLGVKYTFAVELRDKGQLGFLLPPSLIEPTARELFEGLKAMVREMSLYS